MTGGSSAQSNLPTVLGTEMVILTSGHLLTHNTRDNLPGGCRLPIDPSANLDLGEWVKPKCLLSVPLRAVLAGEIGRRVYKHGLNTSVQATGGW